jgi:hypothetical protein
MKDYFEYYEEIPEAVQQILETYDEDAPNGYAELNRLLEEVQQIGWTFDYGLDAEPFDLHQIVIECQCQYCSMIFNKDSEEAVFCPGCMQSNYLEV